MNHKNWMAALKDDVKITEAVIPSAHNAGSYGMKIMACCQDGNVYEQFTFGIRHFCIRLDTNKNGDIVLCHGLTKGDLFENCLQNFAEMLSENESEFFILDIREYYPQKFGPVTLRYKAAPKKVDELLKKYTSPEKYAFADFQDINEVTIGNLRASGKRYILINSEKAYAFSVSCPMYFPWDKQINGSKAEKFATDTMAFFDDGHYTGGGLFWFQTQQTPNPGTEIGITTPKKLNALLNPYFHIMTDTIAQTPMYLERANIISGDFMTENYSKVNRILSLNLLKNNIKSELIEEFGKMVKI